MKKLAALLAALLLLAGCAGMPAETPTPSAAVETPAPTPTPVPTEDPVLAAAREQEALLSRVTDRFGAVLPAGDFLPWLEESFPGALEALDGIAPEADPAALLYAVTGESIHVLRARFDGLLDNPASARAAGLYLAPDRGADDIVLAFGGDINLVDGGYVMPTYRASPNGLAGVLAGGLLDELRAADVLLLNLEFAFTDRGAPLPGKEYVFRAAPENAALLTDMGVDVAFLANNHVFDYGAEGLSDTLVALDAAGVPGLGAGMDLDAASRPVYYIANGRKIAYVGAGCIERYGIFTPGAAENAPGIFRTDEKNAETFLAAIREAAAQSDFVVANLHWGIESTAVLEPYQRELGQLCIDAGADAVVGTHPHVLQGTEFYEGRPIVYSTGNFWFSRTSVNTCLLQLVLDRDLTLTVRMRPCTTGGGVTTLVSGDAAARVWDYYEGISFGVSIDGEGNITAASP